MSDYAEYYSEVYDGLTIEEMAELEDRNYETVRGLMNEGFSLVDLEWEII